MLKSARRIMTIEADAIRAVADRLDDRFAAAIELIRACRGRLVVTGMGKSGLIGTKLAATFSSTGTPSVFLHPAEAIHGDIGLVVSDDVVLAISNSGETQEIVHLLDYLQRRDIPLIAMVGRPESTLARYSRVVLDVGVSEEACPLGLAPTASTTAALALGDTLAMIVSGEKGFTQEDFVVRHPGGALGMALLRVEHLMQAGDDVPAVTHGTPMRDAIEVMSGGGFGMTTVIDDHRRLLGILTDGDLRRLLAGGGNLLDRPVESCMSGAPVTITRGELATRALHLLEDRKITSLPVVDDDHRLVGLLHLHHLWRTGKV